MRFFYVNKKAVGMNQLGTKVLGLFMAGFIVVSNSAFGDRDGSEGEAAARNELLRRQGAQNLICDQNPWRANGQLDPNCPHNRIVDNDGSELVTDRASGRVLYSKDSEGTEKFFDAKGNLIMTRKADRTTVTNTPNGEVVRNENGEIIAGYNEAEFLSNQVNQCEKAAEEARNLCSDPLKYSTGLDAGGQAALTTGAGAVMMMGMVAAGTGGSSSQTICDVMEKGGYGLGGINGVYATRCTNYISNCEKACDSMIDSPRKVAGLKGLDAGASFDKVSRAANTCESMKRKAAEMASATGQSLMASQLGRACAQAAATMKNKPGFDPNNLGNNTDFCKDPLNAQHPFCRDPNAPGPGAGGGGPGFGGGNPSNLGDGDGGVDTAGLDEFGDPAQRALTGEVPMADRKNNGIPNQGGGGAPGGSEGGRGGGDERGKGHGPGYNTNVLQGERGGSGGGSVAAMGFNSGGSFAGYGDGNNRDKQSSFDLSKFLPGGQKAAPGRGPAGLARANQEIGAIHEDIFKKVSDRVKIICREKRLMECQ